MDAEVLLWGVLPAIAGILILIQSIRMSLRGKSVVSWVFTTLTLLTVGFAETMLFSMIFQGAWPTFFPHIIIGGSILLIGLQSLAKPSN